MFEKVREQVRKYLNANKTSEIIYTRGTTEGLNLLAETLTQNLQIGDEIILSESEHHSNIVPWQLAAEKRGLNIRVIPMNDEGVLQIECLDELINKKTKIISVAQVSNSLGVVHDLKSIISKARSLGGNELRVVVDGAQGIVHSKVDVQELDCDFYAFSGHKLYAATGTGVLYGKKKWLEQMPPYMGGGEMVGTVKFSGTTYAPLPMKYEAGTQNFASAATLRPAIDFINLLNDSELVKYNDAVRDYLLDKLMSDERIVLYGVPRGTSEEKIPLFSFTVKGVHHEDLALILDKMGIAVRSGQMCAEPVMDRFGVTGMLRVSLAPYNTMEEAEYFIKCLNKAINMLA
jgi:cysteine desulfurase/selenocysteine lyase